MIVSFLFTRFIHVIAHHAEQCGKQAHVVESGRSNSALGVRGHSPWGSVLVARNSLKFVAHPFDPKKAHVPMFQQVSLPRLRNWRLILISRVSTSWMPGHFRASRSATSGVVRGRLVPPPTEHWHICIAFESFLVCIASGRTIQFARAFHRDDGHQAECITGPSYFSHRAEPFARASHLPMATFLPSEGGLNADVTM